jgi:putative transposase
MYRIEKNVNVKERMLLVLNVVYYGKIAANMAREIHKSKGWASQWLKRYNEEGIEGLKDKLKGGRHPKVSRQVEYRIKTILKESNKGWSTKQVEELILQESGIRYHHNHIYRIVRKWGFKQKVPRKVHVNTTASQEEKEIFKKRPVRYLWMPANTKRNVLP